MAMTQELQVQQKREVESKEESTMPARLFLPQTTSSRRAWRSPSSLKRPTSTRTASTSRSRTTC